VALTILLAFSVYTTLQVSADGGGGDDGGGGGGLFSIDIGAVIRDLVNGIKEAIKDVLRDFAIDSLDTLLKKFFGIDNAGIPKIIESGLNGIINAVNKILESIGNFATYGFGISDFENFANSFSPVFRAFGYSLVILFFGVNFIETTLQYEMMTAKGAVKTFGRILLAKIWVDLSTKICLLIVGIATSLTREIIIHSAFEVVLPQIPAIVLKDFLGVAFAQSSFFVNLVELIWLPIAPTIFILAVGVVGVLICIVFVKLTFRSINIALLIVSSPLFFACWTGDETKQYFKKFMANFLAVTFELAFMAIVYITGCHMLVTHSVNAPFNNLQGWATTGLTWFIILIATLVMMIKPPKILTSIIE
jgi:hypothetical protein